MWTMRLLRESTRDGMDHWNSVRCMVLRIPHICIVDCSFEFGLDNPFEILCNLSRLWHDIASKL